LSCAGLPKSVDGSGGRVAIAGRVLGDPRARADPFREQITLDGEPLPLDNACRYLHLNKPYGVLCAFTDKEGRPTTKPDDFYEGGAILPLGGKQGYKGYLLNFMVEVLAGVLTGGGCIGRKDNPIFNNCTLMIVLDVERFRELPQFKLELEAMITHLQESPVLDGKEVLYPGEVEARREAEVLKTGIPLAAETVKKLQEEMDRYDVSVTLTELAQPTPLS